MAITGQKHTSGGLTNYRPRIKSHRSLPIPVTLRPHGGTLRCELCGNYYQRLEPHLRAAHGMTGPAYRARVGPVPLIEPCLASDARLKANATLYRRKGRLICAYCHRVFWRKKRAAKRLFCERTCWDAALVARQTHQPCQTCGTTFRTYPSTIQQKYCSIRCRPNPNPIWGWMNPTRRAAIRTLAILIRIRQCVECRRFWLASARPRTRVCSPACRTRDRRGTLGIPKDYPGHFDRRKTGAVLD